LLPLRLEFIGSYPNVHLRAARCELQLNLHVLPKARAKTLSLPETHLGVIMRPFGVLMVEAAQM